MGTGLTLEQVYKGYAEFTPDNKSKGKRKTKRAPHTNLIITNRKNRK